MVPGVHQIIRLDIRLMRHVQVERRLPPLRHAVWRRDGIYRASEAEETKWGAFLP